MSSLTGETAKEIERDELEIYPTVFSTSAMTTTTTERVKIYQFNYTALHTPDSNEHGHQEMGFSDSSKMGEYYWDGSDGYRRIISYIANDGGFVPVIRQIPIEV